MTTSPRLKADASIFTRERNLFGCWLRSSMVPLTSPPGVETVMVPLIEREVTLPSAARPPTAVRYFSTISSAVCASATLAQIRTAAAESASRETISMFSPVFTSCYYRVSGFVSGAFTGIGGGGGNGSTHPPPQPPLAREGRPAL